MNIVRHGRWRTESARHGLAQRLTERLERALAIVAVAAAILGGPAATAQMSAPEQDVKAAFLYKFLGFVEWPEGALGFPGDPLVVGVLGSPIMMRALENAVSQRTAQGRNVAVKAVRVGEVPQPLHVLFVGEHESPGAQAAAGIVAGRPVLVVHDAGVSTPGMAAIQLLLVEDRIRFDIDPTQAELHRLKISSRLMQLARRVAPTTGP